MNYNELRADATRWYRTQGEVVLDEQFKTVLEFIEWMELQNATTETP